MVSDQSSLDEGLLDDLNNNNNKDTDPNQTKEVDDRALEDPLGFSGSSGALTHSSELDSLTMKVTWLTPAELPVVSAELPLTGAPAHRIFQ